MTARRPEPVRVLPHLPAFVLPSGNEFFEFVLDASRQAIPTTVRDRMPPHRVAESISFFRPCKELQILSRKHFEAVLLGQLRKFHPYGSLHAPADIFPANIVLFGCDYAVWIHACCGVMHGFNEALRGDAPSVAQ